MSQVPQLILVKRPIMRAHGLQDAQFGTNGGVRPLAGSMAPLVWATESVGKPRNQGGSRAAVVETTVLEQAGGRPGDPWRKRA